MPGGQSDRLLVVVIPCLARWGEGAKGRACSCLVRHVNRGYREELHGREEAGGQGQAL